MAYAAAHTSSMSQLKIQYILHFVFTEHSEWVFASLCRTWHPRTIQESALYFWQALYVWKRETEVFLCADKPYEREIAPQLDHFHAMECLCLVSEQGSLQLKPFRGSLSAWIGLETQFFIREFGVDNQSWLPTTEQQFRSLRKWEGASN